MNNDFICAHFCLNPPGLWAAPVPSCADIRGTFPSAWTSTQLNGMSQEELTQCVEVFAQDASMNSKQRHALWVKLRKVSEIYKVLLFYITKVFFGNIGPSYKPYSSLYHDSYRHLGHCRLDDFTHSILCKLTLWETDVDDHYSKV